MFGFNKNKEVQQDFKPLFYINPRPQIAEIPEIKEKQNIDIKYVLIEPYVYAHIFWDKENNELMYKVEEPVLDEKEAGILNILENSINELINISFIGMKSTDVVIEYLEKNLRVLLSELKINIEKESFLKLMYYIYRDFVGLNEIEPLLKDYYIEDIECNGVNSPIYIVHRKYRNIRTNVIFRDIRKLTSFVEKVAQKCGKYISYATPLLDGSLPDGSVDYEEPIIYKENGIVKLSKIGEFVDKFYKENETNKPVPVENIEVPAFNNKTLKIEWKKADYVYRHKNDDDLFEIDLEFGRKIKLTKYHSIFVLTKEGVKAKKTEEITENDYVVVPLTIPENNIIKEINAAKELSETKYASELILENIPDFVYLNKNEEIRTFLKANYKYPNQAYYAHKNRKTLPLRLYELLEESDLRECKIRPTSAVSIPAFIKIDEDFIKFLGLYAAEGWLYNSSNVYAAYFSLNKDETDLVETLRQSCLKCFGLDIYVEPEERNAVKVKVNSYPLWILLNDVLNVSKGASKKRIPELIFNISKELQQEFLKYWSLGDYGSTASKQLSSDISYLSLFNNDIVPFYYRERESTFANSRKAVSHEYYTNFFVRTIDNTYSKMIPTTVFNPLNRSNKDFRNKRMNRDRIKKIIEKIKLKINNNHPAFLSEWTKKGFFYANKPTNKFYELIKEFDVVNKIAESDLGFFKINSIKKVKSTSEFVYDLSVKDHENFISGTGGVCCHNSRINASYTQDISTKGPAFTVRKFTSEPWSPIKLMQFKTVSPEMLAFLWLAIEHESNILIIGGTGSGKTSLLNSLAFFIPPAARIVTIEDSVTSNNNIIIRKNEKIKLEKIGKFIDRQLKDNETKCRNEDYEILTLDRDKKVRFVKPNSFMRHEINKDVYKIITATGRKIEVTEDHSLFSLGNYGLKQVTPKELKADASFIAVPRRLPEFGNELKNINLLEYKNNFLDDFLSGEPVKNIFSRYSRKDFNWTKSRWQWCKKKNIIKLRSLPKEICFSDDDLKKLYIQSRMGTRLPALLDIDNELLQFFGLWIGDGSFDNYNKNSVIISNTDKECINLTYKIANRFNFGTSLMNDKVSIRLHSTVFYKAMRALGFRDGATNKKIPEVFFGLNNKQINHLIKGYFSADGTMKNYEVSCSSQSWHLLEQIQTLLLKFDIISRINTYFREDGCRELNISSAAEITKFRDIGFLQERKNIKFDILCSRESTHSCSDIIPLGLPWLKEVDKFKKLSWPYSQGMQNIGRNYMQNIFLGQEIAEENINGSGHFEKIESDINILERDAKINFLSKLAYSDIYWDKVTKIEKLEKKKRFVYDISVPETEKFICSNIILKNTRELNLMHENWLPGVTREGVGVSNLIGTKEGEITLFDLLKESFRQRPDYIIVGEIRGKEAYVLFQGMASVRGDEEIFVLKDNKPLRVKIKELENLDISKLKAISYDLQNNKVNLLPIKGFIKHPKRNVLHKIKTRFGREITVTPDHSLFTLLNDKVVEIKTEEFKIGSKIIIPRTIPCNYNNIAEISLLEYLPDVRVYAPEYIKEASNKIGYSQASNLCNCASITDYYSNFKRSNPSAMKSEKFLKLMKEADINFDIDKLELRYDKQSKSIKGNLKVTDEFLRLLGYYISEGSLDQAEGNSSIALYNKNERVLDDMRSCINKVTGIKPDERITEGYGSCLELSFNHKVLFEFIKRYCKTKTEKRIPDFIFGLDKSRIGQFLSALYCGDGSIDQKYFGYYTVSRNLANDVSQLLLVYGIITRIGKRNREGRKTTDYELLFYNSYKKEEFSKYVKPIGKEINLKLFKKTDFKIVGDLYCDEVNSIEILNLDEPEYVYDISVPGNQNFIGGFGSVLLHNSGHPSFGTMHAEDVETLVRRLETPPIELSPALIESLDIACIIGPAKVNNKEVRRVKELVEIVKVRSGEGGIETNKPFIWDPRNDNFYFKEESRVFEKIVLHKGINKEKLFREFNLRAKLLVALYKNNIMEFKEVNEVINAYYKTPEIILKKFNIS